LPERPNPLQKINVDKNAHFRYLDGCWFRLIDATMYGAEVAAQFSICDAPALEKQLPNLSRCGNPAPRDL
jgi:hypothetical protein